MMVTTLSTLADNYTYIVEADGAAVVIDPGEVTPVMRALERSPARLLAVLGTHGHFDHIGGAGELAQRTGCKLLLPGGHGLETEELTLGPLAFVVMQTPGHSADSVSLYLPSSDEEPGTVFTGDTLFVGGCGRVFTGLFATMWESLQLLGRLPPATRVYCGHDYALENYEFALTVEPGCAAIGKRLDEVRRLVERGRPTVPSTIGQELATNPFLRACRPEMKLALGMQNASDAEVFARLRRMKDDF